MITLLVYDRLEMVQCNINVYTYIQKYVHTVVPKVKRVRRIHMKVGINKCVTGKVKKKEVIA